MRRITTLVFFSLAMLFTAVSVQAATVTFTSTINGGNSVPANASTATGTALMSFDDMTNLFNLSIDLVGLDPAPRPKITPPVAPDAPRWICELVRVVLVSPTRSIDKLNRLVMSSKLINAVPVAVLAFAGTEFPPLIVEVNVTVAA